MHLCTWRTLVWRWRGSWKRLPQPSAFVSILTTYVHDWSEDFRDIWCQTRGLKPCKKLDDRLTDSLTFTAINSRYWWKYDERHHRNNLMSKSLIKIHINFYQWWGNHLNFDIFSQQDAVEIHTYWANSIQIQTLAITILQRSPKVYQINEGQIFLLLFWIGFNV